MIWIHYEIDVVTPQILKQKEQGISRIWQLITFIYNCNMQITYYFVIFKLNIINLSAVLSFRKNNLVSILSFIEQNSSARGRKDDHYLVNQTQRWWISTTHLTTWPKLHKMFSISSPSFTCPILDMFIYVEHVMTSPTSHHTQSQA